MDFVYGPDKHNKKDFIVRNWKGAFYRANQQYSSWRRGLCFKDSRLKPRKSLDKNSLEEIEKRGVLKCKTFMQIWMAWVELNVWVVQALYSYFEKIWLVESRRSRVKVQNHRVKQNQWAWIETTNWSWPKKQPQTDLICVKLKEACQSAKLLANQ